MPKITIYRTYSEVTNGFMRDVAYVLGRIKSGTSSELIAMIRTCKDKEERNALKRKLPAINFQGTFKERNAKGLIEFSGLMPIDFDNFPNMEELTTTREMLIADKYTYALFTSPSGNGLKVILRVPADGAKNYKSYFDSIKEYISNYNASELSTIHCQKKIFELEYKNKCLVCKNDDSSLDLTSSYDGFTNMLDILELNERLITLKILVTLSKCSSFTCNKLNLEGFNFNEAFSEYIRRIYFKSCRIKETPNLQRFNNLEVINLSANSIETLDFSRLPKSVKRTNFSKNRIFRLLGNKSGYHNLESMAMFNNKISEANF